MIQQLISIEAAIKAGDKAQARRLLQPLLERSPSADLWFMAAQASDTPEDELKCLQRGLALDPLHGKSRSRLFVLKQAAPPVTPPVAPPPKIKPLTIQQQPTQAEAKQAALKVLENPATTPLKRVKASHRRSSWRMVGCLGFLILSLASSFFVMSVLGLGAAGWIVALITGVQPVTEIDGVPIEDVATAPLLVPANRSVEIEPGQQQVDILYPGYAHEYEFRVRSGDELAVYVQFISPTARNVSPNVVMVDPEGHDAEGSCTRQNILTDNSGVAFSCDINRGGRWKVRIFGRENESSGAYYMSGQTLGM